MRSGKPKTARYAVAMSPCASRGGRAPDNLTEDLQMNETELNDVLDKHAAWLRGNGGSRADLSGADLRGAKLSWADLSWADLRWAGLLVLHIGPYAIYVQKEYTRIGCQYRGNKEWLSYTPEDVKNFSDDAEALWKIYGDFVKSAISLVEAN